MQESLNVLILCPGRHWTSCERQAIRDAVGLKRAGHRPLVYCWKGLEVDDFAGKLDLPRHYHSHGVVENLWHWRRLAGLAQLIEDHDIQVVHCYSSGGLAPLWAVCYALRMLPMVPLLVTRFSRPDTSNERPWNRAITKRMNQRLDYCLTSSEDLALDLKQLLHLRMRKIGHQGLTALLSHEVLASPPKARPSGDPRTVALGIVGDEEDAAPLRLVLAAFASLCQHYPEESQALRFRLVCPFPLKDTHVGEVVLEAIEQLHLSERVDFHQSDRMDFFAADTQLWVTPEATERAGMRQVEDLEDLALKQLLGGIPVLLPRKGVSMELARAFPGRVETYRPSDSRDLMDKMRSMLGASERLALEWEHVQPLLWDLYSEKAGTERLLARYRRLLMKRENYLYRRGKRKE